MINIDQRLCVCICHYNEGNFHCWTPPCCEHIGRQYDQETLAIARDLSDYIFAAEEMTKINPARLNDDTRYFIGYFRRLVGRLLRNKQYRASS